MRRCRSRSPVHGHRGFPSLQQRLDLRRRIRYEDGFAVGEPEIVFKFRHPDVQKVAEVDVRPQIYGDLPGQVEGRGSAAQDRTRRIRLLFSHNVQFPMSHVQEENPARSRP